MRDRRIGKASGWPGKSQDRSQSSAPRKSAHFSSSSTSAIGTRTTQGKHPYAHSYQFLNSISMVEESYLPEVKVLVTGFGVSSTTLTHM